MTTRIKPELLRGWASAAREMREVVSRARDCAPEGRERYWLARLSDDLARAADSAVEVAQAGSFREAIERDLLEGP